MKLLNTKDVADLLDYSYTYTRDTIIKDEDFPGSVTLGRKPLFMESDVIKWMMNNRNRKSA